MSGDKFKIIFLILILTILFAYNSVASEYPAGAASHTTLYTDTIRGKGGGTVNLNDNLVVSGLVSVNNVIVSTSNGEIGRLANGDIGVMGLGGTYGVQGISTVGTGVIGTHINSGNYGGLGHANYGAYGVSGNFIGMLGTSTAGVFARNGAILTEAKLATATEAVWAHNNHGNDARLSDINYGVYGDNGNGNFGYLGGANYGVRGEYNNAGLSNYGWLGGALDGVYARGATYGGRMVNTNGNYLYGGGTNYGGYGSAGGYIGILGDDTNNAGVYGTSANGHSGVLGDMDVGVRGTNSNGNYGYLGGPSYGVYGRSTTGNGVYGTSTIDHGVRGSSTNVGSAGVSGTGTTYGVIGDCTGAGCTYGLYTSDKLYALRGIDVGANGGCFDGSPAQGAIACELNDVAEDIYSKENLENGDVVIIDTENVEHVKKSNKPYDMLAAGIISSNPAFHIKTSDTGIPLALAGRVKAKASAENGPIKIGDLLTTSSTPGHLMKCDKKEKCFGAVVGKALEPLASGKNKITVLVMLA